MKPVRNATADCLGRALAVPHLPTSGLAFPAASLGMLKHIALITPDNRKGYKKMIRTNQTSKATASNTKKRKRML